MTFRSAAFQPFESALKDASLKATDLDE